MLKHKTAVPMINLLVVTLLMINHVILTLFDCNEDKPSTDGSDILNL